MTIYFKNTAKKWSYFPLAQQLASIGAEVLRALRWKNKKKYKEVK